MIEKLLERFRQGDRLALARLLSLAGRGESLAAIAAGLPPPSQSGRVIAFTGSGGVGKSSLVGKLIDLARAQGTTVAVLACDPQSPISGGALLGDRFRIGGQPLVLLTTVGAKTGKARRTLLGRFADGNNWLIVASFAGSARHPAWYFNLARNPDKVWVEVDGRTQRVRPESLQGQEREDALLRIIALAPGYGAYQEKTDREIPVVRLTPVA